MERPRVAQGESGSSPRPLVFLSYLRASGEGWARAVFTELKQSFAPEEIFYDRGGRADLVGNYWPDIARALDTCQIVLAVIDRNWATQLAKLTAARAKALKREQDPSPLPVMCQELEAAFGLPRRVLPLLIGQDRWSSIRGLPTEIAPLFALNTYEIHNAYWEEAFLRLVPVLEEVIRRDDEKEGIVRAEISRKEETLKHFESPSLADIVANTLSPEEKAMIYSLNSADRALYLLQKKMHEQGQMATLLSSLQKLRHQTAMASINNIR